MKKHNKVYGEYSLSNVYFTGYTSNWMNSTRGYYYYTSINGNIVVLLLSPETCEQGNPIIKDITFSGKLMKRRKAANLMLTYLADDLEWTQDGIFATVSPYMISEPDASGLATIAFKYIYLGSFIYTVLAIILHTIFYLFPKISPMVLRLAKFGNPFKQLEEAEEETDKYLQLSSDDIKITLNYFIKLNPYDIAIIPLKSIIWVYKSPQSKSFLWHKYGITYTLHIVSGMFNEVRCPANSMKNTDLIIDYLTEANHNVLINYTEENRKKTARIQKMRFRHLVKKILPFK